MPPSVHQEGWAKHSLIQALAFVPQITEFALEPGTGEVIGHCGAGVSVCPFTTRRNRTQESNWKSRTCAAR
jgi:hypothetical protein